jgi:bifunctional UDP-N-acetylglucosamine pyrophosphorylase/glucosamine-1-phosphate N-acetyltransferase
MSAAQPLPFLAVVLAAGKGTRMRSPLPKVAHLLCEKPVIVWSLEALLGSGIRHFVVVIAPDQHEILKILENLQERWNTLPDPPAIRIAYQPTALGTGHAVMCALRNLPKPVDYSHVLVAYGDTPAVKSSTFCSFMQTHQHQQNDFSILAFQVPNPTGYGRIVCDENNMFVAIREEKDCSPAEKQITLCNSGFLCAKLGPLEHLLPRVGNENASKEYYLTDVSGLAVREGLAVGVAVAENFEELLGVNTPEQLQDMERILKLN